MSLHCLGTLYVNFTLPSPLAFNNSSVVSFFPEFQNSESSILGHPSNMATIVQYTPIHLRKTASSESPWDSNGRMSPFQQSSITEPGSEYGETSETITYTESKTHHPGHLVKWGVDWLVPTKMLSLLITGTALATAHHYYYKSLANTEVV